MNIKLTNEEYEVLLSTLKLPLNLADLIRSSKFSGRSWDLEIAKDDADAIRDFCSEKLPEIGFDEKYEPNKMGKILESLVDKFFIG